MMTIQRFLLVMLAVMALAVPVGAQDRVFSGPQVGEKTTPFRVVDVTGPNAGKEVDYVSQFGGAPTALVFVHALERSMAPLMTVIDEYGAERQERLKTLFVFLTGDRVASEQRLPLVRQSLRMKAPMAISVDGAEGPGNYGLNKKCLLTIVVAKGNVVTANFALVQPGIVDGPAVVKEMARVIDDPNPPTAEALRARRQGQARMERPNAPERQPVEASRFDLNSPGGHARGGEEPAGGSAGSAGADRGAAGPGRCDQPSPDDPGSGADRPEAGGAAAGVHPAFQ